MEVEPAQHQINAGLIRMFALHLEGQSLSHMTARAKATTTS